jgi:hypothetical protein
MSENAMTAPESAEVAPSEASEAVAAIVQRRTLTERALEGILMVFAGALFLFVLSESLRWSSGVALLPRIAAGFGLFMLVIYVVSRFRTKPSAKAATQIMDLGFDEHADAALTRSRTLRFILTTAALFIGVWLIGFHITIPTYVFVYLITYGQVRWWWALVAALSFEAFMVVAYDVVTRQAWPDTFIVIPFLPKQ